MVTCSPSAENSARSATHNFSRPMWKKGPTVCDAVASRFISMSHRRGVAAAQDDVEAIAQRVLGSGVVPVEVGDQALACPLVCGAVEDRIEGQQRIAGKIHLRYQAREKRAAEQREVDVRGTPGVVVIAPGISTRLD